jgi:hypothetical protein
VNAKKGRPASRPSQDSAATKLPIPTAQRRASRDGAFDFPAPWPAPNATAAAVSDGLRRRREAATRMAPLPGSGKRDPIAPDPTPGTLLEVEVGARTCWYYGITRRQFIALCQRAGVARWMHDGRAFCTHIEDAGELTAVAEHAFRWRVACRAVDR